MVDQNTVRDVLRTIDDPEMPISIVDLGMVGDVQISPTTDGSGKACVTVDLLPTFVGCFALPYIESEIRSKLIAVADVESVVVNSRFDPPWSADRITEAGREALRKHGVVVPGGEMRCPFCGSADVRVDSPFGPTRCRMICYCDHCRHSFEQIKRLDSAPPLLQIGQ